MCGCDVLKVALFKHRVFKNHGLHLQVKESVIRNIFLLHILKINILYFGIKVINVALKQKLLVVEVVSLAMHLVFQGEVKRDVLHSLLSEGLRARFIFLLLDVLDHVRKPHS